MTQQNEGVAARKCQYIRLYTRLLELQEFERSRGVILQTVTKMQIDLADLGARLMLDGIDLERLEAEAARAVTGEG
ncbi:MAG TPA: hypothetical protein VHO69_03410 [Phototrophicaceae bacterium]|nr:hypothetical protein [Phototrophicaceae bacterium]